MEAIERAGYVPKHPALFHSAPIPLEWVDRDLASVLSAPSTAEGSLPWILHQPHPGRACRAVYRRYMRFPLDPSSPGSLLVHTVKPRPDVPGVFVFRMMTDVFNSMVIEEVRSLEAFVKSKGGKIISKGTFRFRIVLWSSESIHFGFEALTQRLMADIVTPLACAFFEHDEDGIARPVGWKPPLLEGASAGETVEVASEEASAGETVEVASEEASAGETVEVASEEASAGDSAEAPSEEASAGDAAEAASESSAARDRHAPTLPTWSALPSATHAPTRRAFEVSNVHPRSHHMFVVRYFADKDGGLELHRDISDVTVNLSMGPSFAGGRLLLKGWGPRFLTGTKEQEAANRVTFFEQDHVPGTALMHLGTHPHLAEKVTSGERWNLILWRNQDDARARKHTT